MMLLPRQIKALAERIEYLRYAESVLYDINEKGDQVRIVTQSDFKLIAILSWDSLLSYWNYSDIQNINEARAEFGIELIK